MDPAKEMGDVYKCMKMLKSLEPRYVPSHPLSSFLSFHLLIIELIVPSLVTDSEQMAYCWPIMVSVIALLFLSMNRLNEFRF